MPLRPFPSKFCALYPLSYHTGILALSSSPVWSFISWHCRIQMSFLESAASHHLKDQLACWPGKFPLKRQPRIFFSCSIIWPYLSLVRTLHPNLEPWPPWLPLGEVFHSWVSFPNRKTQLGPALLFPVVFGPKTLDFLIEMMKNSHQSVQHETSSLWNRQVRLTEY